MGSILEITFVRHGRSLADDEDVHEGDYDSPLTDVGISQANKLAQKWAGENRQYDLIVSSSLCRAHKVAQIIGSKLNVDIEVSDQWKERGNGPLAGMAFDEALQKYPKEDFVNPYQPLVVSADAGESMCEMYCRAAMAIQGLIRKGPGKYLVVSHGGFLNGVMNVIMGNQALANEPHVIFMFDDLHYADVRYLPKRDLWVLDKFSS